MVKTLPDIAGADATVPLTTNRSLIARGWVQFVSLSGTCKVGDSSVTISQGVPVPDSQGMFLPSSSPYGADCYVLADLYAYIPAGATLSVAYQE